MKSPFPPPRRAVAGFTLFEILLVVVIGVVLVAGAITYFGQASGSQQAQALQSQTTAIVAGIRKLHPGASYANLSSALLAKTNAIPREMIAGTGLVNVYTGAIDVAPATYPVGAVADNTYQITHNAVPREGCNVAVANLQRGFARIVVGTTVVKDVKALAPVPFSAAALATACANETNVVTLTEG